MYPCDVCGKRFKLLSRLVSHYSMHSEERPYPCNVCPKRFRRKSHLTEHLKLHSKKFSYKCQVCGKGFKQSSGFSIHKKKCYKEKPAVGPVKSKRRVVRNTMECSKENKSVEMLEKQPVVTDVGNIHKCHICSEMFPSLTKLENHVVYHTRRRRYKCLACNRIFKHLSVFKRHQENHKHQQNEKDSNVKEIGDITSQTYDNNSQTNDDDSQLSMNEIENKTNVQQKRKRCKGEPVCKECQKPFSCWFSVRRHINECHQGQKRTEDALNDMNFKTNHTCLICHKVFPSVFSLQGHRNRCHEGKRKLLKEKNPPLPHKCDVCNKSFLYKSRLKEHYWFHTQPVTEHKCDWCGKYFLYASQLKTHLLVHEKEPKRVKPKSKLRHKCKVCKKMFQYMSQLKTHSKTHFLDKQKRKLPCNFCEKSFEFQSHLRRHETTHYNRPKASSSNCEKKGSFKCDVCDKMFQYPSNLREHVIIHHKAQQEVTGSSHSKEPCEQEKRSSDSKQNSAPYKCEICGNAFSYLTNLKRHYTVHNKNESNKKKPYFCPYCDRSFWQTNHMKKHCIVQHHTDRTFKCKICSVGFARKLLYVQHLPCKADVGNTSCDQSVKKVKRRRGRQPDVSRISISNDKTQSKDLSSKGALPHKEKSRCNSKKKGSCVEHGKQTTTTTNSLENNVGNSKKGASCHICGAKLSTNSALRIHLHIHFDRRPFPCRFCAMKFRQHSHLVCHSRAIHKEDFPYQCDLCDMTFKNPGRVKSHRKTEHGLTDNPYDHGGFEKSVAPSNDPTRQTGNGGSEQTQYACSFCDTSARTFRSLSGLRRHISVIHGGLPESASNCQEMMIVVPCEENTTRLTPAEEIYKCDVCSVIVHGSDALEAHEKAHTNTKSPSSTPPFSTFTPPMPTVKQSFECNFCGEEYDSISREAFDQHQLEHELSADEPTGIGYMCVECDKEFLMASDLLKHHEEVHTQEEEHCVNTLSE